MAFDQDPEIKTLIIDLFKDPSTEPIVSLLAYDDEKPVGHILFTKTRIKPGLGICSLKPGGHILAPMAVIPEYQKQGIGGKLIKERLRILKDKGVERCFVLGHKDYYPRYGFIPDAKKFGFPAPYPILGKDKDAWMMQDLVEKPTGIKRQVICADAMMKEKYWKE
ncbi:MAG: N-acetyltransferase [Candidatus Neomarinimicrobiota bacterium]|nr:MAG: N-acetyltransferase [Candidatus Neomarinimicrobiota bacterium]